MDAVSDGIPFCFGHYQWDKFDTMTDLNGTETMFDGKYPEPTARDSGTFLSRHIPKVRPPSILGTSPDEGGGRA